MTEGLWVCRLTPVSCVVALSQNQKRGGVHSSTRSPTVVPYGHRPPGGMRAGARKHTSQLSFDRCTSHCLHWGASKRNGSAPRDEICSGNQTGDATCHET